MAVDGCWETLLNAFMVIFFLESEITIQISSWIYQCVMYVNWIFFIIIGKFSILLNAL